MKKSTTPIEWSPGDWETLRFSPALDCGDEFIKEFAIFGLLRTLEDFGVGPFEGARVAEWYWRVSRSWPRKQSQGEFNCYARARISDFVGYTRRRADAFHIVERLFDKARFMGTTLDEVIDAVTFLAKTEPLPAEMVFENGDVAIIDLTQRKDSPKLLKVDADFLPTLKRLYPFERVDDIVVKNIPVGETSTRGFSLVKLAWWSQNTTTTLEEMDRAIAFRDGDRLNWTRGNLYSIWQARAEARDSGVPAELKEWRDANGDTRMVPGQYVDLTVEPGA